MSEKVLRKISHELNLLLIIIAFSLGISSSMISDGTKFIFGSQIDFLLNSLKISEFIFGFLWLFLSLKMLREIWKMKKAYPLLFVSKLWSKYIGKVSIDEKQISKLIRDLIAFYRGYYSQVKTVLLLLTFVGFSMIVATIYLILFNLISTSEFYFDLTVGTIASVFGLNALFYIRKKWGEKLLRIENKEKVLRDFLGEID